MNDIPRLPQDLVEAFREDRAGVFVGAGASMAAGLPSWDELAINLAEALNDFTVPSFPLSSDILLKIPQYFLNDRVGSRRELIRRLNAAFEAGRTKFRRERPLLQRPVHHYLVQLSTRLFYTTNIDTLLEDEMRAQDIGFDVIDGERGALQATERNRCQVRKIHGTLDNWDNIVLTRSDFASISETRPVLFQTLAGDLRSHVFLFVGYSLRDPDFYAVYQNVFLRMAGKHQTHFICLVDDPGIHECRDLALQGLIPVPVWEYPGNHPTEKILAFLRALVRETSDLTHLRAYYRGMQRHDVVPIVIASRQHESKGYAYYPSADVHAAQQVAAHLQQIGVSSHSIPHIQALKCARTLMQDNLIIICSPSGNSFTKHVFDSSLTIDCSIREAFVDDPNGRMIVGKDGTVFRSDKLSHEPGPPRIEHALIARYSNPWAQGKFIYVFAGCHSLGTHAVGDFLSNGGYRALSEKSDSEEIVAVLSVHYSQYDPLEPKFKLGGLSFLKRDTPKAG